jgi:CDP-diacylglycerol--serine O-phosphatidyltransferase
MMQRQKTDRGSRKSIYLLPNLLTSASLFSGFYAIIAAIRGNYQAAAVAILISGVLDGLDGRVARLTRTTSKFGLEYDSLSDLVAFGVAPGILAFMWGLQGYGRLGWLAAFLYVSTTALRLARFNVLSHTSSGTYFLGLPCPSAAAVVATSVLLYQHFGIYGPVRHVSILIMVYCLSFLMVSSVHYQSFKEVRWLQQHPFSGMVVLILAIMVVAMEPKVTLFVLTITYVISGPILMPLRALRRPKLMGSGLRYQDESSPSADIVRHKENE